MDIKSKKWKNSVGFAAFFLGVSLVLAGGSNILHQTMFFGQDENLTALATEDYQKTKSFQNVITSRLESFITMAIGEYVDDYYFDYYEYSSIDSGVAEAGTAENMTVAEEDAFENSYAGSVYDDFGYGASTFRDSERYTENQKKESAERYHERIKQDKNLLYRISYDGKELYSNIEETEKNAEMPKGYNFYLHFDGKQVELKKDGKEIDVYGDGVYREGENWYVPGYRNFESRENWEKADIVIFAAAEPVIYAGNSYTDTGIWNDNELYYINQNLKEGRQEIWQTIIYMVIGLFCLLVYGFFRKGKREADCWIAEKTGGIWFEVKLLLFIVVLLFALNFSMQSMYGMSVFSEWSREISMVVEDNGTTIFGYAMEMPGYFLRELLINKGFVLVLFWCCYLFFNDIGKNKEIYRHGIFGKWAAVSKSRDRKLSLSRKLITRFNAVLLITFLVLLVAAVFCILLLFKGQYLQTAGYMAILCGLLIVTLCVEYGYQKKNQKIALELEQFADRVKNVHDGQYQAVQAIVAEDSDICKMAAELDDIRQGMETAVEERIKSERMKVELVANVSHDIKTPLTSIISYIELLKQEQELPDYVKDYVHILDEKAQRLKNMVQDVFSVSKAASGQLDVESEELDFGKLLRQTLADMDEQVKAAPVTIRSEIPEIPVMVEADGQRMYRVFQNLIGNALKYSLEGSRIFVTLKEEGTFAVASIKNTSQSELTPEIDFAERFTRGDKSRTDGGSGLGLSIAKSFTEACGGTFKVEMIADLFVVTVAFQKV